MAGFTIKVVVRDARLAEIARRAPELDERIAETVAAEIFVGAVMRAAVDTGFMRDHIEYRVDGRKFHIVSQAGYSAFVEFGTSKMAAQPFMIPSVEAADLDGAVTEALRHLGL